MPYCIFHRCLVVLVMEPHSFTLCSIFRNHPWIICSSKVSQRYHLTCDYLLKYVHFNRRLKRTVVTRKKFVRTRAVTIHSCHIRFDSIQLGHDLIDSIRFTIHSFRPIRLKFIAQSAI